jgi:diguanylate cyclase (GGDEF)-like protein
MKSDLRILLVDNEKEIRETISHILRENGFAVRESGSGTDALTSFGTDLFPLVISDLIMDDMSGMELLTKIKEIRPETEVILLTGYPSIETAVSALRYGAFDYIMKTYDNLCLLPDVVKRAVEKIHRVVEQRTLLESLIKMNTALEQTYRTYSDIAAFDRCTGLYNSRYFREVLEKEVARSSRFHRKFSLVLFTIDWGARGKGTEPIDVSQLFCDVTRSIKQRMRRSDILARYEENVFAMILPETPRDGARCVVDSIYRLIASGSVPSLGNRPSGDIQIIAEAAIFPEDGVDSAALIKHALESLKVNKG